MGERGRDMLDLLLPSGMPICEALHGQARLWPSTSLIIPGNEILFRFRSEANNDNRHWWGYAATITGLKFGIYPQCSIFLDLLHTTAHIVGKCLRSEMVGSPCNELEVLHHKWLQSPLFSKCGELVQNVDSKMDKQVIKMPEIKKYSPSWSPIANHQKFLENLAAVKPDSKAAAFHKNMMGQCKRSMFDKIGGKVVNETINCVIAAMIKHLGLVEIARKISDDPLSTPQSVQDCWNEKLLFVFQKGKDLRSWIGNEKSRHQ